MPTPQNRMLIELERMMREINREVINPQFEELATDDLAPALRMVAHARARYIGELFRVARQSKDAEPTDKQLKQLQRRRVRYEELLKGAQALETAIQRGYLDVHASRDDKAAGEESVE